jgi:SNF2 family DNA or RNA helicase
MTALRKYEDLHGYQLTAIQHIIDHPHSMLWLDMGLGKTVAALTAILALRDSMNIWGTLIVAPLRVCQSVWRQEAGKWGHTDGQLKYSLVTGSVAERERALFTKADVYLINFANLPWLLKELELRWLSKGRYLPFNQIIWDEISEMKNTRTQQGVERGKAALRMLPYISHRVGLTGTPASNGLLDLFGQYLVVDDGDRLGTSFSDYRSNYFMLRNEYSRSWQLIPGADQEIYKRIGDITLNMRAEDYLNLPPAIINDIYVDLPGPLRKKYAEMERKMLLEFDSGHELEIDNEASLINRCLQFAAGACFKAPGMPEWENIHDLKLDALAEVMEEAAGKPVLVLYQFRHDAQKIMKKYPHARLINSHLSEADLNQLIFEWNLGLIPLLIGHPLSIGHGLNIQAGSNTLVWYGINWRLDLYDQAIARLRRQGQTLPVIVNRIMTRDTADELQRIALEMKATNEYEMRAAIQAYRERASYAA